MKLIRNNLQIIWVSFLILFLELLVIRLVGTEIRIFAYLSNLVLLATFIGLGLGMIIKKTFSPIISGIALFSLVVAASAFYIVRLPNVEFRFFSGVTELLAPLSESYIWLTLNTFSRSGILIGLVMMAILFATIVTLFVPLGKRLGDLFQDHSKHPIEAYSANIIASILGLWAFQIFSIAGLSPYFGIVLGLTGLIFVAKDKNEKIALVLLVIITTAFITPKQEAKKDTYWSPYQKLSLSLALADETNINPQPVGRYLEVNNVGYMSLLDISKGYEASATARLHELYGEKLPLDAKFTNQYNLPFYFKSNPEEVLIIGAGAGNDASGAIRQGAKSIDAVEIDPTIISLGKKFHAEKPYENPKVNVVVDDGRSYLQRTNKKYDVVAMGLADSHTLSSSLTNLRLDHYLYTKESFETIKNKLKDDGILFLTFEVTRPWMGDRLTKGLTEVFGFAPTVFEVRSQGVYGWGGYAFVTAKNPETIHNILQNNPELNTFVEENKRQFSTDTRALTDNWPYLYLDKPRLPIIHLIVAFAISIALLVFRRKILGKNSLDLPMFFWGAAFLLFEFQNVSKTSLLFGVTWVTNLFTISAILILLLLANVTVAKKLISTKTAFILLLVTLALQIVVPLRILNTLETWQKIIFASIFLNLPLYFGGTIFVDMFQKSKNKALALGSNFLGSVFGGFMEMFSLLFGLNALLVLTILFYSFGYYLSKNPKFNIAKLVNSVK